MVLDLARTQQKYWPRSRQKKLDSSPWTDYGDSDMQNLSMPQTSQQDDIFSSRNSEIQDRSSKYGVVHLRSLEIKHCERADGVRTYRCPYCSYESLASAYHVQRHVKYKHVGEKAFECSYCSKRFVDKYSTERHIRIHTGEKPFACHICPKKFNQNSTLKTHLIGVHSHYN